jgi:hypothetical protein
MSGGNGLAGTFWLSRLAVTFWLVLSVTFWLSCFGCQILAVMFWPLRSGCHVPAVTFRLSRSGCHVLAVMFWLPFGPGFRNRITFICNTGTDETTMFFYIHLYIF